MIKVPTSDAREQLAELVNRAAFGHERIVLTRHGNDVAVLVSVDDLARLQALDEVSPPPAPRGRRKPLTPEERKAAFARITATMRVIQEQAAARDEDVDDDAINQEVAASRKARRR